MNISILGSSGSVGKQSVDVALHMGYTVGAISVGSNIKTAEEQIRILKPELCAVADEKAAKELAVRVKDTNTRIVGGKEGVCQAARYEKSDVVVNSIVGMAGLEPTLSAIDGGKKKIAIANKETLVCAGDIVMNKARENGVCMFPVDSEHSAIFQCLAGGNKIKKILLTASGGPFFGKTYEDLKDVDVKNTLSHPTWSMGAKITVDSATLANKGFEIIEACHLFGVTPDDIQVVVHRESIIHSMVEFEDNCVIAQMSLPDMRECIQYALTYPLRASSKTESIDFYTLGKLTFSRPDTNAFPLLDFACRAYKQGGIIPSCLNGANEEAVGLFLEGKIKFTDITELVIKVTEGFENIQSPDIDTIIESGYIARRKVAELAK